MTKQNTHQKVNILVKGNLCHLTYKLHALIKATHMGLKTHKLIKHRPGYLEMEFEGERTQLWKIVKWAKSYRFFSVVDEVIFSFSSASTTKA